MLYYLVSKPRKDFHFIITFTKNTAKLEQIGCGFTLQKIIVL